MKFQQGMDMLIFCWILDLLKYHKTERKTRREFGNCFFRRKKSEFIWLKNINNG